MVEKLDFVLRAAFLGIGATVILDLWSLFLKRFLGIPSANWGMIGRWIGHFPRGHIIHDNIAKAAPVRGELAIGWAAHYAIGVIFAALLLAIMGPDWARHPTFLPALVFGFVTVAAPFFILQPGIGAGIAASKMPNPNVARLRSLLTHAVFGIGLYGSALLAASLLRP